MESFAIRNGLSAEKLIWDTDMARVLQLMYCEAARHGSTLRYTQTIECEATNQKQQELENKIEEWLAQQI